MEAVVDRIRVRELENLGGTHIWLSGSTLKFMSGIRRETLLGWNTLYAARIIIGTESKLAEQKLRKIYEPFRIPIVSVSRRSAEMTKYACNDFLALKISYMNDIANLCALVGADIEDVAKGCLMIHGLVSGF